MLIDYEQHMIDKCKIKEDKYPILLITITLILLLIFEMISIYHSIVIELICIFINYKYLEYMEYKKYMEYNKQTTYIHNFVIEKYH